MIPRVWASIDRAALRHNMQRLRAIASDSRVLAVIKADGYGHGAEAVAHALRDTRSTSDRRPRADWEADAFAVACLEEALALRAARVHAPLVVLEGVLSLEEARLGLREHLQFVIHDEWQLSLLEQLPRGARADIWLKLDSGMHRLGFHLSALPKALARVQARPDWRLHGFMTHLASADDDTASALAQAERFDSALGDTPGLRSIANSAGMLADDSLHRDWVRPGLMLYGISPRADRSAADIGLVPAMTLCTRVLSVRDCAAGDRIGYGGAYICPRDQRIATLAVGYADGFQRALGDTGSVLLRGVEVPVVGRVSMDMTAIDVSAVPDVAVGDVATLWGKGLPAERQAAAAGTIPYELCCGLTRRVRKSYDAPANVAASG